MQLKLALLITAPLGLAPLARAQNISAVVLEGDLVPGVGNVVRIDNLAVNNLGDWLVEADTNLADPSADSVMLSGGLLLLQEGQALPLPLGAALGAFDSVTLNDSGQGGFNFRLDGPLGTEDDSGVYLDTSLLIQEGALTGSAQFSLGTRYLKFFETRINNAGQLLVVASVDDPAIPSSIDRALVLLDTDPMGQLLSETLIAREGDLAGSASVPIADFATHVNMVDLNDLGVPMYLAELSLGFPNERAIYVGNTLRAEEGAPSPVLGRNWSELSLAKFSLNNTGGWAILGALSGGSTDRYLIEKSGAKLVQTGDNLPDIGGFLLQNFGSGPVDIADSGDVLWYGDWDNAALNVDTGLFVNHTLVVQEGVTTVGGLLITELKSLADGYAISNNGRFVIFEAVLEGGINGAFLLELSTVGSAFCFGDGSGAPCVCGNLGASGEGCANSTGSGATLVAGGSASLGLDDLTLSGAGLPAQEPALLFAGSAQLGGGLGVPFGDGLRCTGSAVVRLGVQAANGGGSATWGPGLAASAGWIVGDARNFQLWYRDPSGSPCGSAFNLSQAYDITFLP